MSAEPVAVFAAVLAVITALVLWTAIAFRADLARQPDWALIPSCSAAIAALGALSGTLMLEIGIWLARL